MNKCKKEPKWWMWPLAILHLHDEAVCRCSHHGPIDFHDWKDSIVQRRWHMIIHKCERCNKEFRI